MKLKLKVGDICEVRTPAGLAYIQFTHEHEYMGELVRVLPGLYESRPGDFSVLARQKELYFVFTPLRYSIRSKNIEIVSHDNVPEWAKPYPLMRLSWGTDRDGKTLRWKIADASVQWTIADHQRIPVVTELTPEQQKLSIHTLLPHAALVKRLAQGWTPEREEEFRLLSIAEQDAKNENLAKQGHGQGGMAHYLYFRKKAQVEKAGQKLRKLGFEVDVRRGADGETWLALARPGPTKRPADIEGLRDELETLAQELGGEYDGWELAIS